uniref:DNA-directed RNA polymerase III subunit RPC9 n=1 Tax=Albugo laibachii Nc14 TaxID=890382 RepID=F0X0J1_9STRA|nr:conserved hypothetical protein [Albugo laibachii Nc14]|eukprot:CCA27282.1 conserved hypothetical protein [Albugo laibachii Nc14]
MKVLKSFEASLTNYEVYNILQDRRRDRTVSNVTQSESSWMNHKVQKLLSNSYFLDRKFSDQIVQNALIEMKKEDFRLTSNEILQLVNHWPTALVDYHLLIDDCANRFQQDDIDRISSILRQALEDFDEKDQTSGGISL